MNALPVNDGCPKEELAITERGGSFTVCLTWVCAFTFVRVRACVCVREIKIYKYLNLKF